MADAAVNVLLNSEIPGVPVLRGKVRDVYDFGDRLLFIATDRISEFDWVLPTGIPDKGRVLTRISEFWFELLGVDHHLLSMDPRDVPLPADVDPVPLMGAAWSSGRRACSRSNASSAGTSADRAGRNTGGMERSAESRCQPGWSRATG